MIPGPACPDCGTRCEICDERMCAEFGPEPADTCDAHRICKDCDDVNPCRQCATARREVGDMAERMVRLARAEADR